MLLPKELKMNSTSSEGAKGMGGSVSSASEYLEDIK